ncbi:MAG: LamG-like jellyroll fold domain-containing protein [Verrucomicrobiota bacterium]
MRPNALLLLVLLLGLMGSRFPLSAAELLGYYEFEENYADSSGNGNDGVPSQNPDQLSFKDGLRGKGLDVNDPDEANNSGGSVDLPINVNPGQLPGVTFGGWVNVENFEFDGFMAIDNGGWDRGITINARDSNAFSIASGEAPTHGAAVVPGEWQYVVGTFDSEESRATVYVGGDVAASMTTESANGADITAVGLQVIEIGRYDNQDLDGLVDDIFVFDEALDAHQVNAIRNLRLSTLDYSPADAAELFSWFATGQSGSIADRPWTPTSGLVATTPGAVIDMGDGDLAVVLDDAGNGMMEGLPGDSDGDGLDDPWEEAQFGNLDQGPEGDFDEDGLTNLQELELGTQPANADTDRDGLTDGAEVNEHKTDPGKIDTDGDEVSDGAELATGTDPLDPASRPRPSAPTLLAFFDFENELEDASGNGNDARAEQNPDQVGFTNGLRGQGADINDPDAEPNSGGSINLPVDANPTVLPDVSFGGWVNVEAFEFDGFLAIDNGGWDRGLTVNAEDSNSFGIASGAAPVNVGEITPGEWQYVVGTFSDGEDRATLYVGNESGDPMESIMTADSGDSDGELEIELGRYDNQDLDAVVDDIFVFDGELDSYQVNAIRNLRLSPLDYSPADAAALFELFSAESPGSIGAFNWTPVSDLDGEAPGAVVEAGTGYTVVLDDQGNGMMSGAAPRFEITSIVRGLDEDGETMTLTWNSRTGRVYAVDVSPDLVTWTEVATSLNPTGQQTSWVDEEVAIADQPKRYYRVRETIPPPLFVEGFEGDADGWTIGILNGFSETGTSWELGSPTGNGPAAAFEGESVYGTDLDANYEDGTGIFLRSPVIDLTGAGRPKLTFRHFMAASDEEGGRLNILEADGTPILAGLKLYVGPGGNTDDWVEESIRLPDLNRPIIIEFELLAGADDDPVNRAGWFIDDLLLD